VKYTFALAAMILLGGLNVGHTALAATAGSCCQPKAACCVQGAACCSTQKAASTHQMQAKACTNVNVANNAGVTNTAAHATCCVPGAACCAPGAACCAH
jgi:hypothetical protein